MILEKLFDGEYKPAEMVVPKGERYKELVDEISNLQVKLKEELPNDVYAKVEYLQERVSEIGSIDAEEYFKYGFSSGMVLMLEIFQFLKEQEYNK